MEPRVVMVRRRTEYESLLQEHGTPQMAAFRLRQRGLALAPVRAAHDDVVRAAQVALGRVPTLWRKTWVLREDLDRFRFDPDDIIVGVGWDGLVPNVAKYLAGQPVIGVNPFDVPQKMMHFRAADLPALYARRELALERRTMVRVELDDGRTLTALNELFVGHQSHQSARYDIAFAGRREFQSSSGLIVSTGTGATGWASSIARASGLAEDALPQPTERRAVFLVREAWVSAFSGGEVVVGELDGDDPAPLRITSKMQEGGLIFGDGIESDHLRFAWGQTATCAVAPQTLNLVVP